MNSPLLLMTTMILKLVLILGLVNGTIRDDLSIPLRASVLSGQTQYSIQVTVGQPPQSFHLVVDTGSSDLWVQGTHCKDCSLSTNERYNVSKSDTFKNECEIHHHPCFFKVNYGSGNIHGIIGQDLITIGTYKIKNRVQFGITTSETGDMSKVLEASGIIGFGLSGLAEFTIPSISSYMKSFALQLQSNVGRLTVNSILPEYDNAQWATVPVEKYGGGYDYWSVGLPELRFGNAYICGQGANRCQAVIDSGTGFIAVPQEHWVRMLTVFKDAGCVQLLSSTGLQQCPVESLPTFRFQLGTYSAYQFDLKAEDYTIPTDDKRYVAVGIIPSPLHVEVWILGSIFLKNYYFQFDVENRQIRITKHGTRFIEQDVPLEEQPSYFQMYYDTDSAQKLFVFMIVGFSVYGLYLMLQEEKQPVPDDSMLLDRLLDKENIF